MTPSEPTGRVGGRRRLKELAVALQAEPGSIPRRLELASALRDAGRAAEAIELYRGVAQVYAEQGLIVQAMAVCKGILDIDPDHRDALEMLYALTERRGAARPAREPGFPVEHTLPDAPEDRTPVDFGPGGAEGVDDIDGPPSRRAMWALTPPDGLPTIDTGLGPPPEALGPPPEPLAPPPEALALADAPVVDTDPQFKSPLVIPTPVPKVVMGPPRTVSLVAEPAGPEEAHAAAPGPAEPPEPPEEETARWDAPQPGSPWAEEDTTDGAGLLAAAIAAPLPHATLRDAPPAFPLLSELPRGAFLDLLKRLSVVRLPAEEVVVREGELGDACYLVADGHVRVEKAGVVLAELGPGSFFGEFAVLADQRRHASVVSLEPVELLEIKRSLLDELVATHPGVARTLRRFYRERLLSTLMATAPFFARLEPEERQAVAERFRPRRFGRGARIVEEGAPGGGLYLILVGEVQVVKGPDEVQLATLGEGAYFGEISLLRGGVASATVRATRTCEVVQLPPRDFYEVASAHPVLWDEVRDEAARRELLTQEIVAGQVRQSDDVYLV